MVTILPSDPTSDEDLDWKADELDPWTDAVASAIVALQANQIRIYNPRTAAFGAQGNGTADDTAELAAAISAASTAGRGLILLPYGIYLIKTTVANTSALTVPANVSFWAPDGATIKGDPTSAVGIQMLSVTGSDVRFDGITLDMPNLTNAVGIFVSAAATLSRLMVSRCRFIQPVAGGVHIQGAVTDLTVERCHFSGDGYGILVYEPTGGKDHKILGNTFRGGAYGDGVEYNCPTSPAPFSGLVIEGNVVDGYAGGGPNDGIGIGLARVQDATVQGNRVSNCQLGIHVEDASQDVTIGDNVVKNCEGAGIDVILHSGKTTADITIQGNTVRNCCTAPFSSLGNGGIEVSSGAAGLYGGTGRAISVIGNICEDNNAAGIWTYESRAMMVNSNICRNNTGPGIDLTTAVDSVVVGNHCTDTQATKTQTYGLRLQGAATDTIITGNYFKGNLTGSITGTGIGEVIPAGTNIT